MAQNKSCITDVVKKNNRIRFNYQALKPLLITEQCIGIFRFYLKNGQLHSLNWIMKLYSVIFLAIYLSVFVILIKLPATHERKGSLVDIIDDAPSLAILFYYSFTIITSSFFLSKPNTDVMSAIAELDEQLVVNDIDSFYKHDLIRNVMYLVLLFIIQCILVTINMLADNVSIMAAIDIPVNLIQKLEIVIFCIFIRMVGRRLLIINGYISKFIKEEDSKTVYTINQSTPLEQANVIERPSETNMTIQEFALLYDKLGYICKLINRLFNLQIFMNLVSTFIDVVIIIWSSLYYFKLSITSSSTLVNACIWCGSKIVTIIFMCVACERLRLVRNSTKVLVNQVIMDYDLPKPMRVQAKAFMELLEVWPLRFYIYDMFTVDITLILKVISVATTYLIVIIQVSNFY